MELVKGQQYIVEKCGKKATAVYVTFGTDGNGDNPSHMFMFNRRVKGLDGKSYKYAFVKPEEIANRVKEVK